jgi:hypothetical protein
MPNLKDHEGEMVIILLPDPVLHTLEKRHVKLVSVDAAGIWIEDQELTNAALERLAIPASPIRAAMFLPFASIHAIFVSAPGVSLSEKAFGA